MTTPPPVAQTGSSNDRLSGDSAGSAQASKTGLGKQSSNAEQERSDEKIIAKPERSAGEQERSDDKVTAAGKAAAQQTATQRSERDDEKKIGATDTGAAKPRR